MPPKRKATEASTNQPAKASKKPKTTAKDAKQPPKPKPKPKKPKPKHKPKATRKKTEDPNPSENSATGPIPGFVLTRYPATDRTTIYEFNDLEIEDGLPGFVDTYARRGFESQEACVKACHMKVVYDDTHHCYHKLLQRSEADIGAQCFSDFSYIYSGKKL